MMIYLFLVLVLLVLIGMYLLFNVREILTRAPELEEKLPKGEEVVGGARELLHQIRETPRLTRSRSSLSDEVVSTSESKTGQVGQVFGEMLEGPEEKEPQPGKRRVSPYDDPS